MLSLENKALAAVYAAAVLVLALDLFVWRML
jgi:hypothetical protein